MEKAVEINFRRSLAHIFPGFLLYLGLLLAIDTFLTNEDAEQTWVTSFLFKPSFANAESILSVIGIGIFVGYILGILIDGVGHSFLDERIFRDVGKRPLSHSEAVKQDESLKGPDRCKGPSDYEYHTLEQAESSTFEKWIEIKGINKHCEKDTPEEYLKGFPKSQYYLFPFTYQGDEDKVNLLKFLIEEFYSFYEFYRNSGISILVISAIFPFYLMKIQNLSYSGALFVTFFMLLASALLFYAAINVAFSYRSARLYSIEGLLRKGYSSGDAEKSDTKITSTLIAETESEDPRDKHKYTASIQRETKI